MRSLIWFLLIIPCLSCAVEKSKQLQGCYFEKTYTSDVTEPIEKPVTVYNTLKISKSANGKWEFEAYLNGENFHQCSAWGSFKIEQTKDNAIFSVTPGEDALKELGDLFQCKLQILVTPSSFEFHELEGSQCESLFLCGARAHISGQKFSRMQRAPLNDKRCNP